jgi:hypothetical protein
MKDDDMTAEIATIRTASEAAAALRTATLTDLAALDPHTLLAVTDMLRAAGDLARAQRPIVLHGPATYPPAPAAYGAGVRIPAPPARDETRDETHPRRPAIPADRVLWFGTGMLATGIPAAIIATLAGGFWVVTLSALGAVTALAGAAAVNRAEHSGGQR